MVTSMIPNVNNVFKNPNIIDMRFLSANIPYNPLINYDWSTTTTSGLRYLKDVGSTPAYNASMYFGRGAYLNGVDQTMPIGSINFTSNMTIAFVLGSKIGMLGSINYSAYIQISSSTLRVRCDPNLDVSFSITSISNTFHNYNILINNGSVYLYIDSVLIGSKAFSDSGVFYTPLSKIGVTSSQYTVTSIKDMFIFNRALTQPEITQAYEQPELFYAMAQTDSTCVLNMPMCETSSTTRNYKTGIDYPITNYTSSVRDNAKNLQYGLQTCKFVRNSLGVIQSASDYLECDGTGYAIIPNHTDTVNIKMTVNPTSLSGNLLSGGVTKTLTGLTLNIDNNVVISNVTPTGAITLASGFTGTIKSYKEELV